MYYPKRHSSLPFNTKIDLSLDIASGLDFVHSLGVVHGDIKPQNILVFAGPFRAKIADFGHSMFETPGSRKLIGGTQLYAAPEVNAPAIFSRLKLTDVYSYGIVFASILCGYDIAKSTARRIGFDRYEEMKHQDTLHDLFSRTFQEDDNLFIEDPNLVRQVFDTTIRTEPGQRDLLSVITELGMRRPLK